MSAQTYCLLEANLAPGMGAPRLTHTLIIASGYQSIRCISAWFVTNSPDEEFRRVGPEVHFQAQLDLPDVVPSKE
jgi:hypothetical protein